MIDRLLRGPKTLIHVIAYGGMPQPSVSCLAHDWGIIKENIGFCHGQGIVPAWPVDLQTQSSVSDIDRARSMVASRFLKGDWEVLFCLDRDHTWNGPTADYDGDILHLVKLAHEHRAIVGAVICKRAEGVGLAAAFKETVDLHIGTDSLHECRINGFAFTAVHRCVFEEVAKKLPRTVDDEIPFFLPSVRDIPGVGLKYCPEDTSFVIRAQEAGFKVWASTRPIVNHIGEKAYSVVRDSQPRKEDLAGLAAREATR